MGYGTLGAEEETVRPQRITMKTAPRIENRWVCIATNTHVALASVISSYFQDNGVYFPVFEFPSIDTPYSPSSDFGKDGYFGRILGTTAVTRINNAIARLQPRSALLVGLTETEKSYIRAYLPSQMLIEINTIEDISKRLPFAQPGGDYIVCKSSQIIEGLLLAKFSHKRLTIDESAPSLQKERLHRGEGVILIENEEDLDAVAAINYAFAIDADVVLVPPIDRQQIQSLPQNLHAWSHNNSRKDYEEVKKKVSRRINGVNFLQYTFATFFTVGLPYGLILKNIIPCSHVLKGWIVGVYIVENILEEHNPVSLGSALLFSPQQFASEETEDIAKILDDNNYTVKLLLGKDATVNQLANYGAFFPFDLMHICAHGGETDGYFVIQEFTDRQGNHHKLEFYEIVGFAPAGGEMVTVMRKTIFKTFDGFPWMSKPLKQFPRYVFEDMMKALKFEELHNVTRVRVNHPIASSCHIMCHDSIHQGDFQTLAGFGHPVVFNNTCSSSHELAASFIHAGARCYIGTLWSIGNDTATHAAKVFYKEAAQQGNVLEAFAAMNKSFVNKKYQNVYILWGLHFSSFRKPTRKSDANIFRALVRNYFLWLKKIETTVSPEVKRNSIPIARFLREEIVKNFSWRRRSEIKNFDPNAIEDHERTLSAPPEDNFSRGVTELEVNAQEHDAGNQPKLTS